MIDVNTCIYLVEENEIGKLDRLLFSQNNFRVKISKSKAQCYNDSTGKYLQMVQFGHFYYMTSTKFLENVGQKYFTKKHL